MRIGATVGSGLRFVRFSAVERIEQEIFVIRGEKVILGADLAALYDVETRALLQAVKRNGERFPADFMFQLTRKESDSLRSQIEISKGRGALDRFIDPIDPLTQCCRTLANFFGGGKGVVERRRQEPSSGPSRRGQTQGRSVLLANSGAPGCVVALGD